MIPSINISKTDCIDYLSSWVDRLTERLDANIDSPASRRFIEEEISYLNKALELIEY